MILIQLDGKTYASIKQDDVLVWVDELNNVVDKELRLRLIEKAKEEGLLKTLTNKGWRLTPKRKYKSWRNKDIGISIDRNDKI